MKSSDSLSPFIILLVPVLLAVLFTFSNSRNEVKPEKYESASYFRMPALKGVIKTLF